MIKEIWVFYKETNSYRWGHRIYEVSNYGRVKCNGKLYICKIRRGYYRLCDEYLHRIIAEKFLPGWNKNYEIDHKDRNTLNNITTNLLICDHKQNINNPLTIQHKIENSSNKKMVLQYTKNNEFVTEYVSLGEASRQTKISDSHIVDCCKYRRKSAGGYIWKYKNNNN